ncbi:heat shock 70 kDa protein 12A-like isoform X4 [Dreissena polymorpha]|uniref:Uncharacterized protein n=1 Tax=Dreissena polymorpha TaxID=45954 RepID=A0A9D4QM08_DREPO|nr:heat shock 70 kDa protein 12A-like isoform X4 [Dreissena polymorpha]KAH3835082.1 hypothetical protein DPMN_108421 [Dreissena polymorpha]
MDTDWKDKLIVAAIDFGTCCTGFVISYMADYKKKKENVITHHWHSGGALSKEKTPTVLLLHKDLSFKSFGYDAEDDFADIATDPDENIKNWHYFRYFKMKLYDENKDSQIRPQSTVTDQIGREINAMHVFSASIKYLKDKIMETIGDKCHIKNESDVYFILTCPAIWSEKAKQFMRLAAEKAGIANDHLRIGLEPECAAIYLHNVTLPDLSASGNKIFYMKEGDAYMIVDMGGGTVDIAAHKINRHGRFEELMIPDGGPWGSICINYKFEQALAALSGGAAFETFRNVHFKDYTDLMRDFEFTKIAYNPERGTARLKIPTSFGDCHSLENNETLTESLEQVKHQLFEKVLLKNNMFRFHKESFEHLFNETIEHIIDKVSHSLEQCEKFKRTKIKAIFCVGGFSDCKLLRDRFKTVFGDRVIIPNDAITSIVKGAVIFGRDEQIIEYRISRFTYGLDWSVDFDSKVHDPKRKEVTESGVVCKDFFHTIAEKDKQIPTDYATIKIESFVKTSTQDRMEFPFYRTEKVPPPLYIDDPECSLMGSMIVGLDDTTGGLDRYVTLEVYFGASELRAEATDNK